MLKAMRLITVATLLVGAHLHLSAAELKPSGTAKTGNPTGPKEFRDRPRECEAHKSVQVLSNSYVLVNWATPTDETIRFYNVGPDDLTLLRLGPGLNELAVPFPKNTEPTLVKPGGGAIRVEHSGSFHAVFWFQPTEVAVPGPKK